MFDFFRKLFVPERSSETAKERLRLVLLSDHLSLAPETIEALKKDLLEVISRYVDIDAGAADVTFEQRDHEVAMLASIPITGVRDRHSEHASTVTQRLAGKPAAVTVAEPFAGAEPVVEMPAAAKPSPPAAESESVVAEQAVASNVTSQTTLEVPPDRSAPSEEHATPVRSGNAARPRRRRRKKSAASAAAAAKHAPPEASPPAPETGNR